MYKISNSGFLFIKDNVLHLNGKNGTYSINDKNKLYLFLPLFENNKDSFFEYFIKERVELITVKESLNALIKYPFENKMEYWSLLALGWIDTSNLVDNLWLYEIDDKWMSQKLKHQVHKLRKRLRLSDTR